MIVFVAVAIGTALGAICSEIDLPLLEQRVAALMQRSPKYVPHMQSIANVTTASVTVDMSTIINGVVGKHHLRPYTVEVLFSLRHEQGPVLPAVLGDFAVSQVDGLVTSTTKTFYSGNNAYLPFRATVAWDMTKKAELIISPLESGQFELRSRFEFFVVGFHGT